MKQPTRKARLLVVLMVAISAPLWLFLRGWFGFRVFLLLMVASLASPFVMSFLDVLTTGHTMTPPFNKLITDRYYIQPVLIAGCIWQAALTAIAAIWITAFKLQPPHRGFTGSFVLAPATSWALPFDFIPLAGAVYVLIYGLTVPALPFALPDEFDADPWVHFLTSGFTIPPQTATLSPIPMIVCYVILMLDALGNHGLLRYFDYGERPAAPVVNDKPRKPLVARLLRMPNGSRDDLGAIFSRRHPALSRITDPTAKI